MQHKIDNTLDLLEGQMRKQELRLVALSNYLDGPPLSLYLDGPPLSLRPALLDSTKGSTALNQQDVDGQRASQHVEFKDEALEVGFKIENVSYSKLDAVQEASVKASIAAHIAASRGLSKETPVIVKLSEGGIAVQAIIDVPKGKSAVSLQEAMISGADDLKKSLVHDIQEVPEIAAATTGEICVDKIAVDVVQKFPKDLHESTAPSEEGSL